MISTCKTRVKTLMNDTIWQRTPYIQDHRMVKIINESKNNEIDCSDTLKMIAMDDLIVFALSSKTISIPRMIFSLLGEIENELLLIVRYWLDSKRANTEFATCFSRNIFVLSLVLQFDSRRHRSQFHEFTSCDCSNFVTMFKGTDAPCRF